MVRENVLLQCDECGARNYITSKETRGAPKLELKKFCKKDRKHTKHIEKKKS
jgi:large subunit ribosomal protein L33